MFGIYEAAPKLFKSPDTVRRMIRKGNIEAIKIGGKWMISQEEIDRLTTVKSDKIVSLFTKLTDAGYSAAQAADILKIVSKFI